MDIKILDSWLREFLDTKAGPVEIAKYLSLCGPSIERIEKAGNDFVYNIEITTNRIDCASVYGIAREASAILPRFGIPAKLKMIRSEKKGFVFTKNVDYLNVTIDKNLCSRFTAVLIKNVKINESPKIIKERLESTGTRSLNNVVDISNYITIELGQPVHIFDYDKIKKAKMILRESKKGETIETLDGKRFNLPGGDIVIEDGDGRIIDLAGIMGGNISKVDENTKNVLLFVQTYNPVKIRKTSMALAQRTMAATIFEKGTDEELVSPAILKGVELLKLLTKGEESKSILNIYPGPYKVQTVQISLVFIKERLGVEITKKDINSYLSSLDFDCTWSGDNLNVRVPSFRSKDIKDKEDVLEEIARIYGYHNLPSKIMEGSIPERPEDPKFTFEKNIKNIISGFGGTEAYTLSLVPLSWVNEQNLKLKNALGPETEYMRTSLMPSLINAAKENIGTVGKFHIFEISNIYLPTTNNLPEERMMLGGIFEGYGFRKAKGIIEATLEKLHVYIIFKPEESKGFGASKCSFIYSNDEYLGKIGVVENSKLIYYEFELQKLMHISCKEVSFKPIPKYPAQMEDITFTLPEKTYVGEVVNYIQSTNRLITGVNLKDTYQNAYTFSVKYQNLQKTLTNDEAEKIRKEIASSVKNKFGGQIKN